MKNKTTIKDFLEDSSIPKELINTVNRSFEIIGDIAICEIDDELKLYEKEIATAIMKVTSSIKTVLKKSGIHSGEFRTQKLIYISGENKKETIYHENGIKLKINPETVYFSARLSVERQNLMQNLEENKKVLVMFSGIGPYTFVALKKQPNLRYITSIELNPEGHKYAIENQNLNKNILKKSKLFKDITNYLRENNLPIIDKLIIKNLNSLKINQINGDVNKEIKKFNLIKLDEKINEYENLNIPVKELFQKLKEETKKTLNLDLDKLNTKQKIDLIYLYLLFAEKFNFKCKINNEIYLFDNLSTKGYLLTYLQTNTLENITKFDEIFMPLPKDAHLFLEAAFIASAPNATIHMYDFVLEENFPKGTENKVKLAAKKYNKEIIIIQTRKVGQYAPGKYRVCVDFIVK